MSFAPSEKTRALHEKLVRFFDQHIHPNEARHEQELADNRARGDAFQPLAVMEALKQKARAEGLWNLFLPHGGGAGLSNLEYAPLSEVMGHVEWSSEVFNCSAPDTGNMEILSLYASDENKQRWLRPLLDGEIRSAFSMTEPAVASSDATNIATRIERDGDHYVINGRKWWSTGAGSPRCKVLVVMGVTDPKADTHRRHSQVIVPMDTPGVRRVRQLSVYGFDDAPHGHPELAFENVRVPVSNILLGEGRGFEIAQARLGPGRIHHCMRAIGAAERILAMTCQRLRSRVAFGKPLSEQSVWRERIANCRLAIDQSRLLVLHAADKMDRAGNKEARAEIAMIKVAAPAMLQQVVDWAIQAHGAIGVGPDFKLGLAAARARTLRIVDGPDEVHRDTIARLELKKHAGASSTERV
ncbi:MAG: acyl-CoA dehydrogenase family protein [Polyangiales bacterium]